MRGRPPRPGLVTTAPGAPARPSQTPTIAAAVSVVAALLLLVVGGARTDHRPTSGLSTTMTSRRETWRTLNDEHIGTLRADRTSAAVSTTMTTEPDIRWTLNEGGSRAVVFRPRHLRYYRRHRHRHRHALTVPGLDPLFVRPHSAETTSGRRRRRHRHVDDRGTSGASVFTVIEEPPDDVGDPVVVQAEPETEIDLVSGYFRFCDHRLVSSAVEPGRCRSSPRGVATVSRRCLMELAAIDDEAEVIFRRFSDVMDLFDCRHAYSMASHCDDCKVRVVLSVSVVVLVLVCISKLRFLQYVTDALAAKGVYNATQIN